MRCAEIRPYLPGYAGGDLRPDTTRIVDEHVASCHGCRDEVARNERVRAGLATLAAREVEPPAYFLDAVLESTPARRRLVPILPVPPGDLVRLVQEHRDTIASAAGAMLVAAGAAYALWRAVRGSRRAEPATS